MEERKCGDCGGEMEAGFLVDFTPGPTHGRWCKGDIHTTYLGRAQIDRDDTRTVVTYRCLGCGFLRSYAD